MRLPLIVTAGVLAASAALAQGPGMGKGPHWSFDDGNTRGWSMMNEKERAEHREKMLSFKSYEECLAYLEQHHKTMEQRAKERGTAGPRGSPQNMCERMKQAGRFG